MKTKITLMLLCATILLMSSCATILSGSKQAVTFKSNVQGKVYQNMKEIGNTNEQIKLRRADLTKLYTIKAEGCPDKNFELPVRTNGAYWIDIPLCFTGIGLLAAYIDVAFGNHMKTNKVIEQNVDCKTK